MMELLTTTRCPKVFSPRVLISDSSSTSRVKSCPCQQGFADSGLAGTLPNESSLTHFPRDPRPPCLLCVLQLWSWSVPAHLPPSSPPDCAHTTRGEEVGVSLLPLAGSLLTLATPAAHRRFQSSEVRARIDAAFPSDSSPVPPPRPQSQHAAVDFRICADKNVTTTASGLDIDACVSPSRQVSRDASISSPEEPDVRQPPQELPLDFSNVVKHACAKPVTEAALDFRLLGDSWCKAESPWSPCPSRPPLSSPESLAKGEDTALSPDSDATLDPSAKPTRERRKPGCAREKHFQCPYCIVSCSNRGQLVGHLRIHTGERPFVCRAAGCNKAFIRNEELTRHRRIHTGERPYPCLHCPKAFTRKDHLNKHAKVHTTAS